MNEEMLKKAVETLIDVLEQACDTQYSNKKIIIYSDGISSYENAFLFLKNFYFVVGDKLKIEIDREGLKEWLGGKK